MKLAPSRFARSYPRHCRSLANRSGSSRGEPLTIESKAGWSWGCVAAIDSNYGQSGLQTRIATTNQRFIVRADEKLPVFLELESAIRAYGELN